jgi:hypothetical protein
MVAIISRAVYERDMPDARIGAVVPLSRYSSTNAALSKLSSKSRLFLLTVRPPDEALWLVAVLRNPRFVGTHWETEPNSTPVRDVSPLRAQLRFENGKGLPAERGKLGMALQTPRVLAPGDVALFDALGSSSVGPDASAPAEKLIVLNRHEDATGEPCLCRDCHPQAPTEFTTREQVFVQRSVSARGRVLHFWVPVELADSRELLNSVRSSLNTKLKRLPRPQEKLVAAPPVALPPSEVVARPASAPRSWLSRLFGKK